MTLLLLVLLASGSAVVVAGVFLTRAADAIGERMGLGQAWAGVMLLATATSLPELATDVSAVRLGAPNLAAGDLFGSSMTNMLILALADMLPPQGRVLNRTALDSALAACLAIGLNALACIFVLSRPEWTILGIGPQSALIVIVYLAGSRAIYREEASAARPEITSTGRRRPLPKLRRAVVEYAVAALVILLAAPSFASSAQGIAQVTGLGDSFVGTVLLGLSTSLPELVTSITAVRLGAFNLVVGNLFGSNIFNMVIFFAMDVAHPGGNIFATLDPVHALTGFFAVILMAIGFAAIVYRAERRYAMIEPSSALMLAVYLVAIWTVYAHSGGS